MDLDLYSTYSRGALLDSLGGAQAVTVYWDGQLLVAPEAAALLVRVGPAETAPHFPTSDQLRFRPDREYRVAGVEFEWMPEALGRHTRDGREVHLFLDEGTGDRYLYAGRLVLGMFNGARDYRHQRADFSLTPRLPKEVWQRFGGYRGWKLTLNHEEKLLAEGDLYSLERYLEPVRNAEDAHLILTRYEGDSLTLFATGDLAYLSYENEWGGSQLSRNPDYPEDTEEVVPIFCTCGTALDMPLCYVIPKAQALDVLRGFFETGVQPESIAWSEE